MMQADDLKYRQILDYIYEKLPMYHLIGADAYKKDLGNIVSLCESLGNPQTKLKFIHVAGTNGKGSVSHLLASILSENGYKTGLFTSPHLVDFRERIRINGEMISRENVCNFVEKNKELIETVQPSFFEITAAMAFRYFYENNTDIAVIETGLGGRLDATNIITPLVSVITNISFDHEYMLGNSLEKIAGEKAGIIKADVPVVIGESHAETVDVFNKTAKSRKAPIYFADKELSGRIISRMAGHSVFGLRNLHTGRSFITDCGLAGDCQLKNIATVMVILKVLKRSGYKFRAGNVKKGIRLVRERTDLRGRWEMLSEDPWLICDISHNPAAVKETVRQLDYYSFNKLHIVFGLSADKNLEGILSLLPVKADYYFCRPSIPRGLDQKVILKKAGEFSLKGKDYQTVETALEQALHNAGKNDLVLITGSAFVVADALKYLEKENIPD